MKKTVLAIGAHPDDAEFLFSGTLALLQSKGWEIHMATMTAGDCGTKELSKKEISEMEGVTKVEGDPASKSVTLEWDAPATLDKIKETLKEINYPVAE